MSYDISLPLPHDWTSEQDSYEEIDGVLITHLECHLPKGDGKSDRALIDLYVGDMPADTTAEDHRGVGIPEEKGLRILRRVRGRLHHAPDVRGNSERRSADMQCSRPGRRRSLQVGEISGRKTQGKEGLAVMASVAETV